MKVPCQGFTIPPPDNKTNELQGTIYKGASFKIDIESLYFKMLNLLSGKKLLGKC